MNVLMVSLDRKAFREGDPARTRLAGYGEVFGELHIIVYAKRSLGLTDTKIADNVWLYPTNSASKFFYIWDAVRIGMRIGKERSLSIVSGQDVADTGFSAWCIARALTLPLQLQDHADVFDPWYLRESVGNRFRSWLARFLLPKASCIRVVLESGRQRIAAHLPELAPRITVLPVYVPVERFQNQEPTFDLHARYPQFSRIAVMASRLVPQKDIAFALKAFARADVQDLGLIIVGEGPLREELQALARSLDIQDRVLFVPWEQDLVSYYKTADVFLLTSRYESYCRTLVEATAAGLPFISTDVGVARTLVAAGAAGIVLAHDDVEGFVSALKQFPQRHPSSAGLAAIEALTGRDEVEYRTRYYETLTACV